MENRKQLREWTAPRIEDVDGEIKSTLGAVVDGVEVGISTS